jgi:hypothetical protein
MKIHFLLFYYHLFAITFKNLFSAGTKVSRQSSPTVSVTMEAETQTEEEQVNTRKADFILEIVMFLKILCKEI